MRAYSLDFRKKVMTTYKQVQHKTKVCEQFNIARTTLDAWIALEKTTQDLKPLPPCRRGRPFSITNIDSFEEFVRTTPFSKISQLISPFEQKFGYKISYLTLWRGLRKIGWDTKIKSEYK
ncbi:helix-turn-helix domain-containing protein [Acinetobacter calcoaceticus]|uniref:helix-turn-helix domain-containing protein n=1 Tax=Acinetobacter calcoaceticus TaxID=471 RepID=UPI00192ABD68|nr:helix-turn-helix domain-containing protein [Acinetobacter calcoaceticus]